MEDLDEIQRIVKAAWERFKKAAKERPEYHRLISGREYRNAKGYLEYHRVIQELVAIANSLELVDPKQLDQTAATAIALAARCVQGNAPVYWLRESLAEGLWQSNLPEGCGQIAQVIPYAVVIVPQVEWLRAPDGFLPQWFMFTHWLKGEHRPDIKAGGTTLVQDPPNEDKLIWATVTDAGGFYSGVAELTEQGHIETEPKDSSWREPTNLITSQESRWLTKVLELVYQVLLIKQTLPEYVDPEPQVPVPVKGKKLTRAQRTLEPRWIGSAYKTKVMKPRVTAGATQKRSSPRPHWRTGHWHRVTYGEGRKQFYPKWFPPVYIDP